MKYLVVFDLDHTLIYGSYAQQETADFLYKHNKYLNVYLRPGTKEMVKYCETIADIIVFTTAKRDYARKICEKININPISLLSRVNCNIINESYFKKCKKEWIEIYDQIFIVDDSPNVWLNINYPNIKILVPPEFRGNIHDRELFSTIKEIKQILKKK